MKLSEMIKRDGESDLCLWECKNELYATWLCTSNACVEDQKIECDDNFYLINLDFFLKHLIHLLCFLAKL